MRFAIKILLLFVDGLFIGFLLRNMPLVKVFGNPVSDSIVFKKYLTLLHFAGCVMGLKSLKQFWPYMVAFRTGIFTDKLEKLGLSREFSIDPMLKHRY